jgi:hypothetical protein
MARWVIALCLFAAPVFADATTPGDRAADDALAPSLLDGPFASLEAALAPVGCDEVREIGHGINDIFVGGGKWREVRVLSCQHSEELSATITVHFAARLDGGWFLSESLCQAEHDGGFNSDPSAATVRVTSLGAAPELEVQIEVHGYDRGERNEHGERDGTSSVVWRLALCGLGRSGPSCTPAFAVGERDTYHYPPSSHRPPRTRTLFTVAFHRERGAITLSAKPAHAREIDEESRRLLGRHSLVFR